MTPPGLPDVIPTPPPALADPRACKPDTSVDTFNGGFLNIEADPRAAKVEERSAEVYDEDFLDIHANDEMELF